MRRKCHLRKVFFRMKKQMAANISMKEKAAVCPEFILRISYIKTCSRIYCYCKNASEEGKAADQILQTKIHGRNRARTEFRRRVGKGRNPMSRTPQAKFRE